MGEPLGGKTLFPSKCREHQSFAGVPSPTGPCISSTQRAAEVAPCLTGQLIPTPRPGPLTTALQGRQRHRDLGLGGPYMVHSGECQTHIQVCACAEATPGTSEAKL